MYVQGVEYDLEDVDLWEPVLVGVTSKKKLSDEVLKRKENRFLGKVSSKLEVCNYVPLFWTKNWKVRW